MSNDEKLYTIALRRSKRIGDITFHKLIKEFESAKQAWIEISKHKNTSITRVLMDVGNQEHLRTAEKEISYCEKNGIEIITTSDNNYPELLKNCDDAPAHLFIKGKLPSTNDYLSVVGTRSITNYGRQFIEKLFEVLPQHCISVSGLALGTDSEVHMHSIKNKIATVAVLAHGFEHFYPKQNQNLAKEILENNGSLVTEYLHFQKPEREMFLQRNRIIAGLSKACIIVESAYGGGSMNTANFANFYNRDVYALPGKIFDKQSQGCNQLIFQNKAVAISHISDLIENLNFSPKNEPYLPDLYEQAAPQMELEGIQKSIYEAIRSHPMISLDDLAYIIQQSPSVILGHILALELQELIKSHSGRTYSVNAR